jgi:uncharacterized membrane protein
MRPLVCIAAGLVVACAAACGDEAASERPAWCAEAPLVTWENFGAGFITGNCQPCHASTSVARHDAPESVVFDTHDDVRLHRPRILATATSQTPSMPPAGGVTAVQRQLTRVWLECFETEAAPPEH